MCNNYKSEETGRRMRAGKFLFRFSFLVFLAQALFLCPAFSQDIHFSQFLNSPMNLNPAQAGAFDGHYRFVGNFRRQWRSVTVPYQTYGFSADAAHIAGLKNTGAGFSMYNDQAGDSRFSTTQINLAGAYFLKLNKDSSQFLSFGLQSGITQKRIDYSSLNYDNQYDGSSYNPDLLSGEAFSNSGRLYMNMNAGISWMYRIDQRNNFSAGTSLFNINRPSQSFFGDRNIRLDRRLNFHAAAQRKIGKQTDILPAILWMGQGTYREFIIGSSVKYILNDHPYNYRAIYGGLWTRAGDAGYVTIGMDYNSLHATISYDLNYSRLRPASNLRGGFEFSVIYIIRDLLPKRMSYKICPDYI